MRRGLTEFSGLLLYGGAPPTPLGALDARSADQLADRAECVGIDGIQGPGYSGWPAIRAPAARDPTARAPPRGFSCPSLPRADARPATAAGCGISIGIALAG